VERVRSRRNPSNGKTLKLGFWFPPKGEKEKRKKEGGRG